MELEHLLPYVESLTNKALQDIEPILDSDDFYDKENIKNFLEGIAILEGELKSIGGSLNSHIKDKINEINNRLQSTNDSGETI